MGEKLASRIPDLLEDPKSRREFIARCMLRGMSENTARKIALGKTSVQVSSLTLAASVLNKDFGELFYMNGDHEQAGE